MNGRQRAPPPPRILLLWPVLQVYYVVAVLAVLALPFFVDDASYELCCNGPWPTLLLLHWQDRLGLYPVKCGVQTQ